MFILIFSDAITAIAISDQPLHISSQEEQTSNAIPIVLEGTCITNINIDYL